VRCPVNALEVFGSSRRFEQLGFNQHLLGRRVTAWRSRRLKPSEFLFRGY
jgi:hypothetical protein